MLKRQVWKVHVFPEEQRTPDIWSLPPGEEPDPRQRRFYVERPLSRHKGKYWLILYNYARPFTRLTKRTLHASV